MQLAYKQTKISTKRGGSMAKTAQNSGDKVDNKAQKRAVSDFVRQLSTEHKMLVILKTQLYGGKWQPMYDDLKNRLGGKPYIFKLANRINDDMERIEQMMDFEKQYDVDLAEHVDAP